MRSGELRADDREGTHARARSSGDSLSRCRDGNVERDVDADASLLSTSWGFFSDVDVESEKFRFLGGARFTLQAIVRILSRRTYRCDFLYETTARGREHNERHYADADLGVRLSDRPGWRRVSGDVLGLWALNVPWGTETTLAAPRAEFNDGSLDVVLVRVTNRKNMLKLMLDFDAGAHVSNPPSSTSR